jgi:hypothetical protein
MYEKSKDIESPVEVEEVCSCGGYICPMCSVNILTPKGFILIPGTDNCPVCKGGIHISLQKAESANHLRTLHLLINAAL